MSGSLGRRTKKWKRLDIGGSNATRMIHNTVELYGKGGGAYMNVMEPDPQLLWHIVTELYAYSREFYDKERGE